MKKYIFFLLGFLLLGTPLVTYAATVSISPSPYPGGSYTISGTAANYTTYFYTGSGTISTACYTLVPGDVIAATGISVPSSGSDLFSDIGLNVTDPGCSLPAGTNFTIVSADTAVGNTCVNDASTYSNCISTGTYTAVGTFSTPGPSGVTGSISTANDTFLTTTGVSVSEPVSYMKKQVLLVVGTGMAVFKYMLAWLLALTVISALVYYLFRGFGFFSV